MGRMTMDFFEEESRCFFCKKISPLFKNYATIEKRCFGGLYGR